MTVKLTQTKITGFDLPGYEDIGINPNVRMTMGYNQENDSISIKIDKVVRPDLTREMETDISYETLVEKVFTSNDFVRGSDHKSWYVEYDVVKNEISILDLLEFGSKKRIETNTDPSVYHRNELHRDVKRRHNKDFLPLVYIKTFDKNSEGFSASLINFYTQDLEGSYSDTIILNDGVEEITTRERQLWIGDNLTPKVSFVIKSEDGSTVINSEPTILFIEDERYSLAQDPSNKYRATLPAGKYTIDVNINKVLYPENENQYDIRVVNGYINKTRAVIGAGTFSIKLDISELDSGDFSKLKLDIGQFQSYSELWIDIE